MLDYFNYISWGFLIFQKIFPHPPLDDRWVDGESSLVGRWTIENYPLSILGRRWGRIYAVLVGDGYLLVQNLWWVDGRWLRDYAELLVGSWTANMGAAIVPSG